MDSNRGQRHRIGDLLAVVWVNRAPTSHFGGGVFACGSLRCWIKPQRQALCGYQSIPTTEPTILRFFLLVVTPITSRTRTAGVFTKPGVRLTMHG